MPIHSTAILSDQTEVAEGAVIGPYVVTKGTVRIGKGTVIENNVTIGADSLTVEIGENNHFMPGSAIGGAPQLLSYKGEPAKLIVGNNNVIREFCTLNTGMGKESESTCIGDNCLLMAYVHIAHNCTIKNHVVIANSTHLGGHVLVEDYVKISGGCLFNQFTTLGEYCYIAGDTSINKDVLPYTIAFGQPLGTIRVTNKIGLERNGFSQEEIRNIHRAIRLVVKGSYSLKNAMKKIEQECKPSVHIDHILNFIRNSKRGLAK